MQLFAQCLLLTTALLAAAGCARTAARSAGRVPDWEDLSARPQAPLTGPPKEAPELTRSEDILNRKTGGAGFASNGATAPKQARSAADEMRYFPETWVQVSRWAAANGLEQVVRVSNGATPTFSLSTPMGTLVLRAGSIVATWDGMEVHLGFPPQLIEGQLYLHSLDLRKTVSALVASGSASEVPSAAAGTGQEITRAASGRAGGVVAIDAGHGGTDAGTRSVFGNRHEKEFTLDWARRLDALLRANGWQVCLTRSSDVEVSLSNRVAIAEENHSAVFLSLHFNSAGPDQAQRGLETYCLTPAGMASTLTRGFSDNLSLTFPNNAFDTANLQLAIKLHRELLRVNGHHDRGVRRARFPTVLRGQNCPSVLIEGGYLSNPEEARLIGNPEYRQKLAEAVARALGACPAPVR